MRHPPAKGFAASRRIERNRPRFHSVSAAHYENFPVASFLLPRAQRHAVLAIYRFARAADDIADEGDAPPTARLAELDRLDRKSVV